MLSTFEFADDVVGILINTEMDEKVFKELQKLICDKIETFGRINLFIEVEKGNEISVKAVMKHLKFSIEQKNSFNKIAVVTEKSWFKKAVVFKDLMIPADVRAFTHEDRVEAIRWIAE